MVYAKCLLAEDGKFFMDSHRPPVTGMISSGAEDGLTASDGQCVCE